MIISIDCCLISVLQKDINVIKRESESTLTFQEELEYFPIPLSTSNQALTVSFVDSWQSSRNYGGERVHEGCDIITSLDHPGVYPVVSMSDGVVEKIGWLKLGGYRIGIRTESGVYIYYAHMESYAPELKEGSKVHAGECIGFVGNTGYGEEGTTGMFVTHLHLGFYIREKEDEAAINPYPYLVKLQEKKLKYNFQEP